MLTMLYWTLTAIAIAFNLIVRGRIGVTRRQELSVKQHFEHAVFEQLMRRSLTMLLFASILNFRFHSRGRSTSLLLLHILFYHTGWPKKRGDAT